MFYKTIASVCLLISPAFAVITKDCPEKIHAKFSDFKIISKAELAKSLSLADIDEGAQEEARELIAGKKSYETTVEKYKVKNGQCLYKNAKKEFARLYTKIVDGKKHNYLHVAFPIDVKALEMPNHEFWMEIAEYKGKLTLTKEQAEIVVTEKDEQYTIDYHLGSTKKIELSLPE